MALHNLDGVFNGGAVKFDSTPQTNFYIQLLAKQQAKRDALDQYYTKALTDVTPSGMRNKDVVGGWSKKLSDWQDFGMNPENRKKLLNPRLDNYKTLTEFNQRHQDLIQDAERSKRELEEEKFIRQHQLSGTWNPTDDDIQIAHRKGLSIYDPERLDDNGNEPDVTNFSFNVPQFTPLKQKQAFDAALQGMKPTETFGKVYGQRGGKQQIDKLSELAPDQIKTAADKYSNYLQGDKSMNKFYNEMLHSPDASQFEKYSKTFKQYFPDEGIMDSPQKLSKAVFAEQANQLKSTKTIRETDPEWMQLMKERNIYLNASLRGGDNTLVPPPKDGENYDLTERLQGIKITGFTNGKAFGVKPNTKILYSPKSDLVFYTDINGDEKSKKFQEFKKDISTINTAQDLKIVDDVMKSIVTPKSVEKNSNYTIKGKNYTEQQLLDMGYSIYQIKPYKKKQ